jgi:hypothetical protein
MDKIVMKENNTIANSISVKGRSLSLLLESNSYARTTNNIIHISLQGKISGRRGTGNCPNSLNKTDKKNKINKFVKLNFAIKINIRGISPTMKYSLSSGMVGIDLLIPNKFKITNIARKIYLKGNLLIA